MKKLIVAAIAAVMMLIGTNASAQYTAFFGYAHNGFGGSEAYDDIDFHGIWFGLKYDIAFSSLEGLTFEPGANFVYGNGNADLKAIWINVPFDIKYTLYDVMPSVSLSAFTGPRVNFGVGNAFKSPDHDGIDIKNFDMQWGVGAAVSIVDAVQIRLGYDFGIHKVVRDVKDNIHRNTLLLGVGFMF